jgi:hypothetical protein
MLEAYSLNVATSAESVIPFNNATIQKSCTATLSGDGTIQLNKCGVYLISVDASAATATTIQLFKDGVAQAQAQSTGTSPSFVTLVQTDRNNSCCACSSPTHIQLKNLGAEATFTNVNIVVTKVA